jgi:hypothetical protein
MCDGVLHLQGATSSSFAWISAIIERTLAVGRAQKTRQLRQSL